MDERTPGRLRHLHAEARTVASVDLRDHRLHPLGKARRKAGDPRDLTNVIREKLDLDRSLCAQSAAIPVLKGYLCNLLAYSALLSNAPMLMPTRSLMGWWMTS